MRLVAVLLFVGSSFYAQGRFSCGELTASKLSYKYTQIKHLGLAYKFPKNNQEVIPVLIDILKDAGVKQVCIDAWYDDQQNGTVNNYNRYINTIKSISKDSYLNNYDYLEIFSRMINVFEASTDYKRTY